MQYLVVHLVVVDRRAAPPAVMVGIWLGLVVVVFSLFFVFGSTGENLSSVWRQGLPRGGRKMTMTTRLERLSRGNYLAGEYSNLGAKCRTANNCPQRNS